MGAGELEEGRDPSSITSLRNGQRSPKFQVTSVSRDLGRRRRENSVLCLILFFFLQCRRKEVGSSFLQNMLLPCVQQVLCYRSATQLHPLAWPQRPHQAQQCCTAPHCRQRSLSDRGVGLQRLPSQPVGTLSLPLQCRIRQKGTVWRSPVHPSLQLTHLRSIVLC